MKSIYSALALAGGLLFAAPTVQAQTPPDAQCITATATTPYTQPGSTYGNNPNNFDWKTPIWNLWVKQDNGTTIPIAAESPFWAAGNVSYPNTNHLAANGFGDPRDYEPGDGWELIMDDRGTSTNSVRCPTVILYNRYEAKVRLF